MNEDMDASRDHEHSTSGVREPAYLQAECGVRYWEDGEINGTPDEDGSRTPCRVGEDWRPLIDLETGRIVDWPQGVTADVHYKVCDDGRYRLLDAGRAVLCTIDGYVPKIMSPGGSGYGDYVIMKVGPDGLIESWRRDLDAFYQALSASTASPAERQGTGPGTNPNPLSESQPQ
jgi:hypothetical protein